MTSVNYLKSDYQSEQIESVIQNAQRLEDLMCVSNALLPLQEFKQLLLSKLGSPSQTQNQKQQPFPLTAVYFKVLPLEVIFGDDVLCSIIQYLSADGDQLPHGDRCCVYPRIAQLNRHFHRLMHTFPVLYQQYTVRLKFCTATDLLYIYVSHATKTIHVSHFMEHGQFVPVKNVTDINHKFPFLWFCAKKLYIVPAPICSRKLCSFLQTQTSETNTANHQNHEVLHILQRLICNTKSLRVSQDCKNIENEKQWMQWLSIDGSLFHLRCVSKELVLGNLLHSKLKYLNLTGTPKTGVYILHHSFHRLHSLCALKMDTNNTFPTVHSNEYSIISFPKTLEFVQIENFNYFSTNYILNFARCTNLVAVSFKSTLREKHNNPWSFARYSFHRREMHGSQNAPDTMNVAQDLECLSQCMTFPASGRGIECVLLDASPYSQSVRCLYQYFDSLKVQNSHLKNDSLKVKYVRYVGDGLARHEQSGNVPVSEIVNEADAEQNRIGCKFGVVLDEKNNDGLLWKLLLMARYRNQKSSDEIENKITMYRKWFDWDIAKWICHLGT